MTNALFARSLLVTSVLVVMLFSSVVDARSYQQFTINYHYVGEGSASSCFEGLCVSLFIKNVNVNGDKSRIYARMSNSGMTQWKGAYRLTNRDDSSTFASLRVDAKSSKDICEILPAQRNYRVVLRQDA